MILIAILHLVLFSMGLSWHSSSADFANASVNAILEYLESSETFLGFGAQVKRISANLVLKRRTTSMKCEYENLAFVWNLCDHNVLRVPKPIRQFQGRDGSGFLFEYLLMEYLPGSSVEDLLKLENTKAVPHITKKVIEAILHLQQRSRDICSRPGPLDGGVPKGFPWGEYGAGRQFASLQDLQICLNQRLGQRDSTMSFPPGALNGLVLCHLDLVPRNIMIMRDTVVGIVDWETLAIYPPIFELAALSYAKFIVPEEDLYFVQELERELKEVTTMEDNDGWDDYITKLGVVQTRSISNAFGAV